MPNGGNGPPPKDPIPTATLQSMTTRTIGQEREGFIREVVQAALALGVVFGGGFIIAFVPSAPKEMVATAMGAVLGYYFGRSASATRA